MVTTPIAKSEVSETIQTPVSLTTEKPAATTTDTNFSIKDSWTSVTTFIADTIWPFAKPVILPVWTVADNTLPSTLMLIAFGCFLSTFLIKLIIAFSAILTLILMAASTMLVAVALYQWGFMAYENTQQTIESLSGADQ